jgi:hypothetical protein
MRVGVGELPDAITNTDMGDKVIELSKHKMRKMSCGANKQEQLGNEVG